MIDRPRRLLREASLARTSRTATLLLVGAALGLLGCGKVAAYERGKLAHPTMEPSDAASSGQDHVYAIHEGAVGGTIGVASGCGCN